MLLDIWMPDTDGVTLLREWAASGQLTMPVIMMSGHGTIETAVEATKIGAFDFLEKPVGLQKLLGTVARALKVAPAREPRRVSLAAIGTSAAMRDVERQMEQLLAAPQADADPRRARRGARRRGTRAARRRHARVALAGGCAARGESARRARRGPRRHALLCRDRPIRKGRAARARVPAAQARQGERHARLHQRGAAGQHGRRGQVRCGAARGAVRGRRAASAAARAARGHPGADRALLARVVAQERNAQHPGARVRDAASGGDEPARRRVLARQSRSSAERRRQSRALRRSGDITAST